ncbi:DNA adenine methylase [Acutalibacter muris]|uniref:DNA adenine methylase n=1 Tax=Acutalibacter muris TaxID=1796620 RepID=UPI0021000BF2|nr:DNA adenine methylase [Acutalibacter muris]
MGGKQALYRMIIDRFPSDYRERKYVEVFGGGASVLLNKDRSVREAINDRNSNLVNLYRMVRERPLELQDRLRYVLNSREDFDTIKRRLAQGHNKDPVKWAADFFQLIKQSYGGGGTSFGGSPRSMRAAFPIIDAVAERLQYVVIENMDFERFIKNQDGPGTLFYLDPPYVLTEDYYGKLFGPPDHFRLADLLMEAQGLWLLSYNYCDTVVALYSVPGIYIEKVERINNLAQRYDPGAVYEEVFISNYDTSIVLPDQISLTGYAPVERNFIWK